VAVPPGAARPRLGDVVAIIPNHICPVVDLVDSVVAVTADGSVAEWPVDARGRSG
jgi:D-serine deaminase-like pyridoxal phosphate-dependent protein